MQKIKNNIVIVRKRTGVLHFERVHKPNPRVTDPPPDKGFVTFVDKYGNQTGREFTRAELARLREAIDQVIYELDRQVFEQDNEVAEQLWGSK